MYSGKATSAKRLFIKNPLSHAPFYFYGITLIHGMPLAHYISKYNFHTALRRARTNSCARTGHISTRPPTMHHPQHTQGERNDAHLAHHIQIERPAQSKTQRTTRGTLFNPTYMQHEQRHTRSTRSYTTAVITCESTLSSRNK